MGLDTDQAKTEAIWDAFGQFINRQLRAGKGVWIPKLGQFTFTSKNVDLAVSYNPLF